MSHRYNKIIFIHPGKANLPEINAYSKYFSKYFEVEIYSKNELKQTTFDKNTILWFIMGFYKNKYRAGYIIHDYRSLSVGLFSKLKDRIKKYFNQKPNLRIFLNEYIASELNFSDNIPSIYIDMGVPDYIKNLIKVENSNSYKYDFIYVGEISKERESDLMIINFLKTYKNRKKFLLVGNVEPKIKKKFKKFNNIIFTGKVKQEEVFKYINQSEFCVNFIPNKYPYFYQTSTKFLEYASMKKKIISNYTFSNCFISQKYSIETYFVNGYTFPIERDLMNVKSNKNFNYEIILWHKIIKNSKIEDFIVR